LAYNVEATVTVFHWFIVQLLNNKFSHCNTWLAEHQRRIFMFIVW